ncbi:MAG: hypothetical protein IPP61_05100 [Cytophagaceae bacterium]|nr:hypothetical protein [Cytophagaceae bacterium]
MQKLLFFLLLPFLSFSQNSKGQLICIPPKDFSKVIREAITAYNLQNPNQIFLPIRFFLTGLFNKQQDLMIQVFGEFLPILITTPPMDKHKIIIVEHIHMT